MIAPTAEDNRAPATGRPGEVIYPSEVRAKNVVYEGRVQAADPASLERPVRRFSVRLLTRLRISWASPRNRTEGGWSRTECRACHCLHLSGRARPGTTMRCRRRGSADFVLTIRLHVPTFFVGPAGTPNTDS